MKTTGLYYITLRLFTLLMLCVLSCTVVSAANKYVVVIDAGHGGMDHGAIDNNVREKDINLAVALKVGEYIKKNSKNVKVVYTRDKDTYLTLQQRADKANSEKGDLFISIHTNSVDAKNPKRTSVEGASTYTLGLHKNQDNMSVARRENSVMTLEPGFKDKYEGFNPQSDESYIIFEMAQKANMAKSVKLAEQVQKQLSKTANRKDRGVHQAGFWVLWATSMPSILVELDFICNPKSAQFLTSENGEKLMAKGIGSAVIAYFKAMDQSSKNHLNAEENVESQPEASFGNGEEGVVLAEYTEEVKTEVAPQPVKERTRKPANRRRRSDASREKSERRQYAEAIIKEEAGYVDKTPDLSARQVQYAQQTAAKDTKANKNSKNKKENKKKKNTNNKNKNKQVVAAKTSTTAAGKQMAVVKPTTKTKTKTVSGQKSKAVAARQTAKPVQVSGKVDDDKSPVRLSKVVTVYKIQILSSSERLKSNNPLFMGLAPLTCIQEGDEYKYFYGESENRNEIYHLLSDVQDIIPDAQVVKIRKSI